MRIDLKWAIPFVVPFLLVALSRGLFWFSGVEWRADAGAVFAIGLLGFVFGGGCVAGMIEEKKHLWVTIGRGDRL